MLDEDKTQAELLEELQELRLQVNQQLRIHQNMDASVYTLVHHLRRSLSLILGFSDYLIKSAATLAPEALQKYLEIIFRAGEEMSATIDAMFLLVHVRDDELPECRPLEMREVVGEAVARLRYIIEQKHAMLTLATTWPTALGYAPWVEELWYALISEVLWLAGEGAQLDLGGEELENGARFWVRVMTTDAALCNRLSQAQPSVLVRRILAQLQGAMSADPCGLAFILRGECNLGV